MDAKLQRRVQRYGWDAAARIYEGAWRDNLRAAHDLLLELADLRSGQAVLETAAGSGLVTTRIAEAVAPGGKVTATDISAEMVALGAKLELSDVAFERMDSEALDYDAARFDRAICALGLMYMPNPQVALEEMKRVLKPGGKAAVAVWGERRKCGWAELFPIVDARVQSEVCPLFFGLGAPGALASTMTRAGFADLEERRITSTIHYPDDETLLEALIDGGAVALAAKRFTPEIRQAVDQEFLASVAQFRTKSGYEIPGEFVVAAGKA